MKRMTYGTARAIFPVFLDLDSQTLKHRRVARRKLTPALDWRSTLDATPTRFHGAGSRCAYLDQGAAAFYCRVVM
jgi:hypothetical protein